MIRSRLITLVLIFIAVSSLALRPFPAMGAPNYGPGVKPGDEVTYGQFNFTSNLPYPVFPANLANLKLHVNTVNIQTKDVNASLVYNFQNGTQQTQQLFGNTATGTGNLFPYITAGNLTAGDSLARPDQYPQYVFNETVQRQYAGMVRTVNVLNLTISQPGSYQKIAFYWDALTGMLLEASDRSSYSGTLPAQNFSIFFKATSTNIWTPSTGPDFTFDAVAITTEILHAGETADFQLDTSSINSFSGQINITAAPTVQTSKLSLAIDPSSITLSSTNTNASATLQVSAAKTTPVGLYIISVNATSGSITHNDLLLVAVAPPDFIMSANPASLTLPQGTATTSTITITGRGGFNGTIGIQEQQDYGSPINVMISNPFVTVNATSPTATTTLTVDATFALPGTTQISLNANIGNIYRFLVIPVNVTGPDYRLTSTPISLSLPQDQSIQATIQVTSLLSFKGLVDLTASAYGVTTTLNTPVVDLTPDGTANSTLTVTAPIGLSPGQYSVYVSGQDTRGLYRSIYIPVTVTGPDFTLTTDRSFAILRAGQNANFTVTLSSVEGFNGTLTLSSSVYGSLTTSISPSTVTLNSTRTTETATVTVTAPSGATPSQFYAQVSIQASSGLVQRYTYIQIEIVGPDFSIISNPSFLSLSQGTSGTSTLILSSIENFTGTINLSASTFGPLSALISPSSVSLTAGGAVNASLTVNVLPGTLPGYYAVNVLATSGSLSQNVYIQVNVVGPDFTFTSIPTSLTIKQGQSATTTAAIQSLENFTGTITLVTSTFYTLLQVPNTTTINLVKSSTATVQLQFTASLNATPGFYNVQIQAMSGSLLHTVYMSIQIVGPVFSLFTSPQNLTIKQGDSAQSTLFLNSIDGFSGNITVITFANGINATPSNTTLTLAAGQSANTTITIKVPTSTQLGGYYVSVEAYSGSLHRYSTIFVQVIGPDFTLLVLQSPQTIEAGTSAAATIQLTSLQGFTGNITLTATGFGTNATGGSTFVKLNPTRVTLSPGGTATASINITTTKAAAGTNLEIVVVANGTSLTHFAYIFISIIGPSFSLSANSYFLTISNGGSATDTITAASIDNFSGQVTLTVQSQSQIVTTLSSTSLTLAAGGTSNTILNVSLAPGTTSGYYSVLVIGISGNQTRSFFITVQVLTPDFTVQPNPSALTIQAGGFGVSTIQLTSLNGYHGNITLHAYFFISGNSTVSPIRVTIKPSTVNLTAGSSASAIANITATASAVGFNTITIQATDGNITHYTSIFLNVIGPTFSLSAIPQFLNVRQGDTGTISVAVTSIDNFTGIVNLSVLSPFGFTAALLPENVTLTAGSQADSTLNFSVQSASGGFYSLIVTGTSGNITRSVFVGVNVTAIGTFTITATPSFLLIPPGGTAQSIVSLQGLGGFTGTISLSASSVVVFGPTATVNPQSITLNSTMASANATVTITLPANTTGIFDTVQVIARGNGLTQIANIGVLEESPDFFVVAEPTNVTIRPPSSQTVKLSIVGIGGFNQTLHFFGLSPLQTGAITFKFDPANVTITPSNPIANVTATISVTSDANPGVWETNLYAYYNTTLADQFVAHFASIALTILPTPEYQILSVPNIVYLFPGSTAAVNSTLQSMNGFSGDVTVTSGSVSADILTSPSSFIAHLASNQTLQFNTTISAALNTPPGTYIVFVNATSPGIFRGGGVLVIVRARPDFTISTSPSALTVQAPPQGIATISLSTIKLAGLNFFNGTITLSAYGAPPGVSTSVSPSLIQLPPFGNMTSTLTLVTTPAVKPGTYTIYILGNSTFGPHTANITLTVTPPPDFKLSSLATTMIIAKGSEANTLLTLSTEFGFSSPVNLATTAPQGITASYSVNPLTNTSPFSTLTILVANTVATGNYKILITGTGGSTAHSVSINVTVASSSKISLTVQQTLWTHKLSLSKNNNLQTFTAMIKNTGQSPVFIQLLTTGNSTSSSLFFNLQSAVMIINPGQTITVTLTQQFNASSIGQKFNVAMQFFYGTMLDQYNNILTPATTAAVRGTFTVVK